METINRLILRQSMHAGAIYGGIMALMLSSQILIPDMAWIFGVFSLGVFFYAIFRNMTYVKSQVQFLSYGKALLSGVSVTLFIGMITGFFIYLWYAFDPQALKAAYQVELMATEMMKGLLSDYEYQLRLEQIKNGATPLGYGFKELYARVFIGFIISLIAAIFIKSKNQDQQQML